MNVYSLHTNNIKYHKSQRPSHWMSQLIKRFPVAVIFFKVEKLVPHKHRQLDVLHSQSVALFWTK
jgi:zinc transporter ZupT